MMAPDQEELLLVELRDPAHKEKSFRMLMKTFQQPVYYFVRRMLIDHDDTNDVVQNTFVKAWKGLEGFRGDCKLSSWLFKIARNESYTFINQSKKIAGIPLDELTEKLPGQLANDELYSGDEIARKLDTAIATLPDKQKEVFLLKYFQDLPYEEISEITGTTVGGLKANYHHAVNKIKSILEQD